MIALLLLSCSDYGFGRYSDAVGGDEYAPAIEVEPRALDFWSVAGGEVETLTFTVRNVGDALLQVEDITLEASASFALLDSELAFDLGPGEARELTVSFSPLEPAEQTGEVRVFSDDTERPEVPVTVAGEGRAPSLQIDPEVYDFGELPPGCGDAVELLLQNVGNDTLTVSGLTYDGGALSLRDAGELPISLAPSAWVSVWVDFAPETTGDYSGALTATSNDPRGELVATQSGRAAAGEERSETFEIDPDPPVDIVLAIDRSCSMEDDAEALAESFSAFIDTLSDLTTGWQLGVVTLDDGCFNGGPLSAGEPDLEQRFTAAVTEGSDREISDDEALFQLIDASLDASDGGCNDGFLRDGAPLHAIAISDEPERSGEQAAAWTWDFWLERFVARAAPEPFLFSGVVDADGCSEGDAGYAELIAATGGAHLSICSPDWSAHAEALATASATFLYTFALSETPASDLEVLVDGEPADEGDWRYDPERNAVIFEGDPGGDEVEVHYALPSTCP